MGPWRGMDTDGGSFLMDRLASDHLCDHQLTAVLDGSSLNRPAREFSLTSNLTFPDGPRCPQLLTPDTGILNLSDAGPSYSSSQVFRPSENGR